MPALNATWRAHTSLTIERMTIMKLPDLRLIGISRIVFAVAAFSVPSAFAQSEIPAVEWQMLEQAYPAWRMIVRSAAYATWLEAQPIEVRSLTDSRVAVDSIRLLNLFQRYRLTTNQDGTFRLTCTMQTASGNPNAPVTDEVIWVDLLTSKVSGFPAIISSDYIEYTVNSRDPAKTVINRQTGSMQISDSKFPLLAQGRCTKAGPRQF